MLVQSMPRQLNRTLVTDSGAVTSEPKQTRAVLTTGGTDDTGRVLAVALGTPTTMGRGETCTYRFDDESVSGVHAQIVGIAGAYFVSDQRSTNGTFVNDERLGATRQLHNGDRIRLGPTVALRFNLMDEDEQQALLRLYEAALLDGLTRVFNRKHLEERLDAEIAFAARHASELSVIMLDVDFFKKVNDNHGHPAGDAVLRHVAGALGKALRTEDLLARYGGEEFVVAARGTALAEASILAERLRRAIEGCAIELPVTSPGSDAAQLKVTASFGVASFSECALKEKGALLQLADERLYRAKQSGRNRVCAG